jgi:hypothetical protein
MMEFPKHPNFFNIVLEGMIDNVVICEVYALTYVVLSRAENHVPYGGIIWYKYIAEVSHKPGSL